MPSVLPVTRAILLWSWWLSCVTSADEFDKDAEKKKAARRDDDDDDDDEDDDLAAARAAGVVDDTR